MDSRLGSILDHWLTPRVLLVALLLAFATQLYVSHAYGDVYPMLQLPGVPGTGVEVDDPVIAPQPSFTVEFRDGSTTTIDMHVLLRDVPETQQWPIVWRNFGPERWKAPRTALEPWVRARLADLFPGRQASAMAVQWHAVRVYPHGSIERSVVGEGRLVLAR
jgi:hypothetical protein